MNQQELDWMEQLSNAFGPSGFEEDVTEAARRIAAQFADTQEDNMRNLYIYRKGNTGKRPLVMLDAHSDEVGFMIQFIRPNGTLQFLQLGSWNESSVPGTKVLVRNDLGEYIPGIVAAKPVHFMTETDRNQSLHTESMVIDIGAVSDQEVRESFHVQVGAPAVPDVRFQADAARGIMMGKAFDCRVGCLALLMSMRDLAAMDMDVDVAGVLSSQEEVGGRGARVAARTLNPAVTVGFEGCPADDTFTEPHAIQSAMKKGPMLRLMDVSMITNPRFAQFALDVCRQKKIAMQVAVRSGGGTNGGVYHSMQKGIPSITVSIPSRYVHTPQGFAAMNDLDEAVRAATEIVKALKSSVINGF